MLWPPFHRWRWHCLLLPWKEEWAFYPNLWSKPPAKCPIHWSPTSRQEPRLHMDSSVGYHVWFPHIYTGSKTDSEMGRWDWPHWTILWWRSIALTWNSSLWMKLPWPQSDSGENSEQEQHQHHPCWNWRDFHQCGADNRVHNYQIPSDDCFAHLEVQFRFFGLTTEVEGVLGRTYRPDFENPAKRGVAMPVVVGEDRYKTSTLTSTDCSSCKFSPAEAINTERSTMMDFGTLDCSSRMGSGYGIVCRKWIPEGFTHEKLPIEEK